MDDYRWLPLTKVRIPATGHALRRDALIGNVATAMLDKRLTLLSAPTGSGKTMLAAMALHATPDIRVAWLSLDEEDNDPKTFLIALLTALQTVDPAIGQWVTQALTPVTTTTHEFTRWLGTLVNELLAQSDVPFVLVLDDFHLLTDSIISVGLTYLMERIPPHFHLVATTRYEPALPLARLRAQGHVAEFHLPQLLFTPEETTRLLNDELGLDLSVEDMAQVQQRSEGWIAGVRLLSLSLGQIAPMQRTTFLAQMSTQDHYVFDLLAEEVLAQQPPNVRQFLLETSVLRDLTPDLCRAVTQRDDAAELLTHIYRRNLFLMAVEGKNATRSYRYHALFQDFLRHRLERNNPTLQRELHVRAAAHTDPLQSFYHYVRAEAWDAAVSVLVPLGRIALLQGRYGTLRDWLEAIPEPLRYTYPWLLFLEGSLLYYDGQLPLAYDLLQVALAQFEVKGDREGEWETMGVLAQNVLLAFNPNGREYLFDLTQRLLDSPIPAPLRARTQIGRAWWFAFEGNWEAIGENVTAAMEVCRTSNNLQTYGAVIPHLSKPLFFIPNGRLRITNFLREFVERFGEETSFAGSIHITFADDAFFSGAWQKVRQELTWIHAILTHTLPTFYLELNWLVSNYLFALAASDTVALAVVDSQLMTLLKIPNAREVMLNVLALQSYRAWVYGESKTLNAIQVDIARLRGEGVVQSDEDAPGEGLIDAMVALLAQQYQVAEPLLRRNVASQRRYLSGLIIAPDARILLAHLYLRQRRREEAVAVVEECFAFYVAMDAPGLLLKHGDALPPLWELAETIPTLRPFTARLRRLWADLRDGRSLALPDSDERLTPREVEVLQLLATGISNRDIADQLVVSERTVKSHVTHILDKLSVASRGQAVARARDLHLL